MIASTDILDWYFENNFRVVVWPEIGDSKGPNEKGWTERIYTRDDYREGMRVGLMCGHELSVGKFIHDVDIDWADGAQIAQSLLPATDFMYGRPSKKISHCWYTTSEALPSFKYIDPIDQTCYIELRGTKLDGTLGNQTMAPPSVWSKDQAREPLAFVRVQLPTHIDEPASLKQLVCLTAIAMLLARHFGKGGFGHEVRLAFAGFLLRAGVSKKGCTDVGNAIMRFTGNNDKTDIGLAVESTDKRLKAEGKKVRGGPALAKHLGDNGRAIVTRIEEWLGVEAEAIPADQVDPDTVDLVWERVDERNRPETLFRRQQKVVTPVASGTTSNFDKLFERQLRLRIEQEAEERDGAQFVEVSHELFTEIIARSVPFVRYVGRGKDRHAVPAYPSQRLVKQVMASPVCPLPVGRGIIRTPSFDARGTLLRVPGYHAASGLFYVPPPGFDLPDLPTAPTAADVRQSLEWWKEVVGEFPVVDEAGHAHLLALALTVIVREMISGPVPMCLVSKPETGTGGTLVLQCIGQIVLGEALPESTWSHDQEEQRKYLTTVLMRGRPLINLDNITYLFSKDLLSVLSGGVREDRRLGGNELLSIPNRACFVGSGNNPTYDEEHAGRLYIVRMDAGVENPRLRDKTFRHPNLIEWTTAHRPELVAALLTIVQAWIAAKRPSYTGKRLAGFEAWSNVIGGILQHAQVPGFLANRDQVMRVAQRSQDEDIEFVTEWRARQSEDSVLGGDVKTKDLLDQLGAAVPAPKSGVQPTTISLGRYLERNLDKVRTLDDGTQVVIRRGEQDAHKNQQRWRLVVVREGTAALDFAPVTDGPNPYRGPSSGDDEPF